MLPAVATLAPLFTLLEPGPDRHVQPAQLADRRDAGGRGRHAAVRDLEHEGLHRHDPASELEEAATVDGAGSFGVFRHVILPLSTPVIAVTAFFGFLAGWTEFYFSWAFLSPGPSETLAMALNGMVGQYAANTRGPSSRRSRSWSRFRWRSCTCSCSATSSRASRSGASRAEPARGRPCAGMRRSRAAACWSLPARASGWRSILGSVAALGPVALRQSALRRPARHWRARPRRARPRVRSFPSGGREARRPSTRRSCAASATRTATASATSPA